MIEILKLLKLPPGVAGSLKFPATRGPPSACFAHRFTQDRVTLDGQLQPGGLQTPSNLGNINPSAPGTTYIIGNPIPGRSTTPPAPPLSRPDLERLADFIAASKSGVLVITGAGCSTESNVPDYRSPGGAYSTGFKPMTHQAFMASAENRSRYWARSFAGWLRFSKVQPNAAHEGIARLQQVGWVSDVVTQNVDRLHHKAGSSAVLELHGTTHEVVCMSCCATYAREEVQAWMEELNPEAAEAAAALAAAANEADEMERLLKAGTAAPVAPSLRVSRSFHSAVSFVFFPHKVNFLIDYFL